MKTFSSTIQNELIKISTSRAWWVICGLLFIIQPVIAFFVAKSFLDVGLDATPATHPELLEALPPLDYLGFSSLTGNLPLVILGGMIGASEYKFHQLRTTLLCQSNRIKVYVAKVLAVLISSVFISTFTIYISISTTHVALGEQGLHPVYLSTIAWQYIGFTALNWILLTLLSFALGLLFKNAIVPLAFLIPQLYNLGGYLAEKWEWGNYLPVAAGDLLIAKPTEALEHAPVKGAIILLIWVVLALLLSYRSFIRHDIGGKYLCILYYSVNKENFFPSHGVMLA